MCCNPFLNTSPLQLVHSALDKAGLLGTPFIPANFKPSVFLQIEFLTASVQLGNNLKPSEGAEEPRISFLPADPLSIGDTYTLLSFDPDAPSREDQKFGPWRHWIIGGLKPLSVDELSAHDVKEQGLVQKSEEALAPWVGPSPGQGTGLHRYCFLLYKQTKALLPMGQAGIKSNERPDRRNFDVKRYADENGLELVGANFFYCENP
ncbi:hypothetical protein MNV49_001352 [Pseudohyphozyma bogoriensis]|nr:hypothetical protein MNV49_001352 [Pseudohyphozyma bogoriensis]